MEYLKVKNWENFQHYKERTPPWIKLHRDLLRDYDFSCLQDASKLHLMLIWLLASQLDNEIPVDADFIQKQIGVSGKINFKELIDKGFLIDASNTLASCKQVAMPETETYSKEKEYIRHFEDFWLAYPKRVNKGAALKVFIRLLNKVDYETLISGAKRYTEECRGKDEKFIAHASTWLNGKRWLDEQEQRTVRRPYNVFKN